MNRKEAVKDYFIDYKKRLIDLIEDRDGADTLESIEFLVFADTIISN